MHAGRISMNPAAAGMSSIFPPPRRLNYAFPLQAPPRLNYAFPVQPTPLFYDVVTLPPVRPMVAVPVRPVWAENFFNESAILRHFATGARYVAIDVHYPGIVYNLVGKDHNSLTIEERYAVMKANVDHLKPLQVAIAICDHEGRHVAWEFNLRDFRRFADPHVKKSLDYLAGRGLDINTLSKHGVHAYMLRALLMESGLIGARRGRLSWITYSGAYHVAYLLKIIAGGAALPDDVAGFVGAMRYYLGEQVYDVERIAADCPGMPVGLERIATNLGIRPPWRSPCLAGAAGVRAVLAFRSLKYGEFRGNVERYQGVIQGLQY